MRTAINFRAMTFIAIMAICSFPMFGQGPGGGQRPGGPGPGGGPGRQWTEEDVKERVKRQTQTLGLSEEQEKTIMDFEIEQNKKMQVERQKNEGDWEKMRESMGKQREVRDKKYEEVLTPEQYKKYKQAQEERRQEMQQRRDQNPGQNPGQTGGQAPADRPQRGRS